MCVPVCVCVCVSVCVCVCVCVYVSVVIMEGRVAGAGHRADGGHQHGSRGHFRLRAGGR